MGVRFPSSGPKYIKYMTHTIKEIVKGTTAKITHVCEGKVYYEIHVPNSDFSRDNSVYQLEIDSNNEEWKNTYLYDTEKSIMFMRWIRKGIADETFIQIK
jgi:hypothetical protein